MTKMQSDAKAQPVRNVFIMFGTHLDIGYTHPPDRLELLHKKFLDDVLAFCREFKEYRYTIEEAWLLRQWLKRTPEARLRREMVKRIREGRIEVCGAFASMHGSNLGPEETNQLAYEARRLREELGIEIVTVMQNDLPGNPWSFPQVFAKSGFKYMFAGLNITNGGGLDVEPRTWPIRWEGIDGSRLLLQTSVCYTLHHADHLDYLWKEDGDIAKTTADIDKLFEGNPSDTILLLGTPSDNKGPLANEFTFRRMMEWNKRKLGPYRFVAATPRMYFEHLEKTQDVDDFPVWRGDWPASLPWDLVKVRAPRATEGYRLAQSRVLTAEKLLALDTLLAGQDFPRYDVNEVYAELLNYGEHSAPEGPSTPALTRREILWSNHVHFMNAYRAFNLTEGLLLRARELFRTWVAADGDRVIVFNPLSWERDALVYVPTHRFHGKFLFGRYHIDHLVDMESGERVAVDNLCRSEWSGDGRDGDQAASASFVARNLPAFGYRVYKAVIDDTREVGDPTKPLEDLSECWAENEKYRVEVDARTGEIASIFDKELNRDICGGTRADGTPAIFNTLATGTPATMTRAAVRKTRGATFEKLEILRAGSWFAMTEIRLTRGVPYVEVRNTFDRALWLSQYGGEGAMLGLMQFPIRVKKEMANVVVSGPNGFRRIPDDLLPGSPKNAWPSTAYISVDDGETSVMISSLSDYLFVPGEEEGDFFDLQTHAISQGFGISSRTNGRQSYSYTEPREDDRIYHSYAITSRAGVFEPQAAHRFGWGYRTDAVGHYVRFDSEKPVLNPCFSENAKSIITVDDPDVALLTLRGTLFEKEEGFIARLQEVGGRPRRTITLRFAPELSAQSAALASMLEERGNELDVRHNAVSFEIGPFETLTMSLDFPKQTYLKKSRHWQIQIAPYGLEGNI